MKINVSTLNKDKTTIIAIRKAVYQIPINQFFPNVSAQLVDTLLDLFLFGPVQEALSADKKCKLILDGVSIKVPRNSRGIPNLLDNKVVNQFLFAVIGFKRLPVEEFFVLFQPVKNDLAALLALIEEYKRDTYIIGYLEGKARPEHEARVRIDFYERCLAERDRMLHYLDKGIYQRALSNCSEPVEPRIPELLMKEFRDRPYYFRQGATDAYFDYRKINRYQHRLLNLHTNPQQLQQLFRSYEAENLDAFYTALNTIKPYKELFIKIKEFYIRVLPVLKARQAIFAELENLFQAEYWFGCSALALIQVEGLFSDMMTVINPQKYASSLPTKVAYIRPYDRRHGVGLDYFQYYLPRIRNKLLHSGNIPEHDFKILSFDLLYDLWYLLDVATTLHDASSQLNTVCNSTFTPLFMGVISLRKVFTFVEEVSQQANKNALAKVQQEILGKWDQYRKQYIYTDELLEVAQDLLSSIKTEIYLSFRSFQRESEIISQQIDIAAMPLDEFVEKKDQLSALLQQMSYDVQENFGELYQTFQFLKTYKKYLPECDSIAKGIFDGILKEHKATAVKIEQLKTVLIDFGFAHSIV